MVEILVAAVVTVVVGAVAWKYGKQAQLTTKEGFAIVGLAWIMVVLFGTLPYIVTSTLDGITNAFFESAAGFTTTGASVIAAPENIGHGVVFWRATSQWLGGMGIIVLSIAILPLLGVGGVELARAESPGPRPDRLTPRFKETAKRLWFIYVACHRRRDAAVVDRGHDALRGDLPLVHHAVDRRVQHHVRVARRILGLRPVGRDCVHAAGGNVVCPSLPGSAQARRVHEGLRTEDLRGGHRGRLAHHHHRHLGRRDRADGAGLRVHRRLARHHDRVCDGRLQPVAGGTRHHGGRAHVRRRDGRFHGRIGQDLPDRRADPGLAGRHPQGHPSPWDLPDPAGWQEGSRITSSNRSRPSFCSTCSSS